MNKKMIKYSLLFFISLIFCFGIFVLFLDKYTNQKGPVISLIIEIPKNSSLKKVSEILQEKGLIENQKIFYWYVRLLRNDSHKMQAGYYEFMGQYSPYEIAERLLHGFEKSYLVTIKEGQNIREIASILEKENLLNKEDFLKDANEGYIFPDTYFFNKSQGSKNIIKVMHNRLLNKLDENINNRIKELNTDLHSVLTLASIIEKEAQKEEERSIIASVYLNRLRKGMPLQADPTVIYGMKDYQGKIYKKDLLTYHPYNTYKIKGLPPGPIANPGLASIKAALWPANTQFLYFVSRNDGSHKFCPDLPCHNRAVKEYQIDYFK